MVFGLMVKRKGTASHKVYQSPDGKIIMLLQYIIAERPSKVKNRPKYSQLQHVMKMPEMLITIHPGSDILCIGCRGEKLRTKDGFD